MSRRKNEFVRETVRVRYERETGQPYIAYGQKTTLAEGGNRVYGPHITEAEMIDELFEMITADDYIPSPRKRRRRDAFHWVTFTECGTVDE